MNRTLLGACCLMIAMSAPALAGDAGKKKSQTCAACHGPDGSRPPSENELAIARYQGRHVATIASALKRGRL